MKPVIFLAALMLAPMSALAQPMPMPLPVTPEMVTAPQMAQTAQDAARLERLAEEERERRERESRALAPAVEPPPREADDSR